VGEGKKEDMDGNLAGATRLISGWGVGEKNKGVFILQDLNDVDAEGLKGAKSDPKRKTESPSDAKERETEER